MFNKYLYLIASLCASLLFIRAFRRRPDLRLRMLVMGIIVGIVGILSEIIFLNDYWRPPMIFKIGPGGPEDFILGFVMGGWASVMYEVYQKRRLRKHDKPRHWILAVISLSELLWMVSGPRHGINSVYSAGIGLILPTILMMIVRRDLIRDSLFSALIFASIMFLGESLLLTIAPDYINKYFLLNNQVPFVGHVPVTEILWGFTGGASLGIIYEFFSGKRSYKIQVTRRKAAKSASRRFRWT